MQRVCVTDTGVEGFTEAVARIAVRAGSPPPDLSALDSGLTLWEA
jgi:hypothetical protein